MGQLLFYSLIGGVFSLIGGALLLWRADLAKRFMLPLLSFAAGAFLGTSFFDILPEALEMVEEPHPVLMAALVGFVLFFILERFLMRYFHVREDHEHAHADHTESLTPLLLAGDGFHNFLDGMLIGLAYLAEPTLGLVTALAVAAHEIPQEIGDFSVLLNQGWSRGRILGVNVLLSLTTVLGAFLAASIGSFTVPYLPYLLASVGGIFIYLAASDLIPEIHHLAGHRYIYRTVSFFILSIILVGLLTQLAHG